MTANFARCQRIVVKPGGAIRLLEDVRPQDGMRRFLTRIWGPWVLWAYGAGFDRDPERCLAEAGLETADVRFVFDELIRLISARVPALAA